MPLDPRKAVTDEELIMLEELYQCGSSSHDASSTYESPLDMCGRANLVTAIIWRTLHWNVSCTLSRSTSAKSLQIYCLDALLISTLSFLYLCDCELMRSTNGWSVESGLLLNVFLNRCATCIALRQIPGNEKT